MPLSSFFRPTRSRRSFLTLGRIVAVVLVAVSLAACATNAAGQLYNCPMHPDYVSDRPGDCPVCGMRLVPMTAKPPGATAATQTNAPAPTDQHAAESAGVRTVAATKDSVVTTTRAVGTVVADETRIRLVTTKVSGWVEKLYVNAAGQPVNAGQPLLELYSPELLASEEEYVRARQTATEFAKSPMPEVRRGGEDLATAARRRLELFDVPADFLQQLDATGQTRRSITFRAPFSGHVTEKNVLEGQRIEPGMALLTVTDLSRVWVTAQVYETEATAAQPGRPATITMPYDTNTTLHGRVSLVYPALDTETRTIKVRLDFPNPHMALKPGMFVNVALESSRQTGVVVPDSAVIDTGIRQLVFVQSAAGRFEQRDVSVGARADGKVILRTGVRAGERVAVTANFLLDSESRLGGSASAAPSAALGPVHEKNK